MLVRVHRPWLVSVLVLLLVSSSALAAPPAAPQDLPELKALKYRLIGPAWGGRVSRVAGVAGDPRIYYTATASGGVWKSEDGGIVWKPVSDEQAISSMGSIAVAPSDPNVVYVGSGEANIRGNVAAGNGIYKSMDAGKTWSHVWKQEGQIGEMVVHPKDPDVAYACGQVRFTDAGGGNLEGAYWRYEMAVREMESALAGVTAGNGAIYAVRRDAYIPLRRSGSHDLSFPFAFAKRGQRSLYVPWAKAQERMVPTLEGEFARKRRMMVGLWDIVVGERMLAPRGYPPLYALELFSHRLLRYLTPFLHVAALLANLALLGEGWVYAVTLGLQLTLLAAALLGRWLPLAPLRIARYYTMTTASIAAGLWDRARNGPPGAWEKAAGTR